MLNIKINGQHSTLPPGTLVAGIVAAMQLDGKRFAVERNGEIVPKSLLAETPVVEGDQYEIVIAVGGG
ncbi:MAG: sulfur carrier protein ThiS [Pseudomonadota bacterium]